jgi:hypothetical protein
LRAAPGRPLKVRSASLTLDGPSDVAYSGPTAFRARVHGGPTGAPGWARDIARVGTGPRWFEPDDVASSVKAAIRSKDRRAMSTSRSARRRWPAENSPEHVAMNSSSPTGRTCEYEATTYRQP